MISRAGALALAFLVVQNVTLVLLMWYSRSRPGVMYLASTAVVMDETLKLCTCVLVLFGGWLASGAGGGGGGGFVAGVIAPVFASPRELANASKERAAAGLNAASPRASPRDRANGSAATNGGAANGGGSHHAAGARRRGGRSVRASTRLQPSPDGRAETADAFRLRRRRTTVRESRGFD